METSDNSKYERQDLIENWTSQHDGLRRSQYLVPRPAKDMQIFVIGRTSVKIDDIKLNQPQDTWVHITTIVNRICITRECGGVY